MPGMGFWAEAAIHGPLSTEVRTDWAARLSRVGPRSLIAIAKGSTRGGPKAIPQRVGLRVPTGVSARPIAQVAARPPCTHSLTKIAPRVIRTRGGRPLVLRIMRMRVK